MKVGQAFPGTYLKIDDLAGKSITVVIDRVEVETVGRGDDAEEKPVLYFRGKERGLALNRTNADSISAIIGDDEMDHWKGHRVVIYPDPSVMFGSKRVGGIRVKDVEPSSAPPPPPVITDDDVPF